MVRAALLAVAFNLAASGAQAQQVDGAVVFSQNCAMCHTARGSQRVPQLDNLRLLQPKFVVDTLASGAMRLQGMRLNPAEMRAVAEYVTAKTLVTEVFDPSAGRCPSTNQMADISKGPRWASWGIDVPNRRFWISGAFDLLGLLDGQPHGRLDAVDLFNAHKPRCGDAAMACRRNASTAASGSSAP